MRWSETLRISLAAVTTNRLRSLLTVLGIFIGIASVTLTVGLGQGAQEQVKEQISSLGSNLLIVSPGSSTTGGIRGGRGSATTLTRADATALSDKTVAPDIAKVAAASTSSQVLTVGTTTWTSSVVGTSPDWLDVRARTLASGRFFSSSDAKLGSNVVVLGATTASELFSGRPAVGQSVTISGTQFSVVGVLASTGSSGTTDEDDQAVVSSTAFDRRIAASASGAGVSTIYLQAAGEDSLPAAYQEAYAALATRHNAASVDFSISSQQSLVEAATATDKTLTILLGGIAAISLLVGGIGVMNIMLVSVSERVREIGLRKALGARPSAIRTQFLMEAATLSLAGGLLGIGVGLVGAKVLPALIDQPVTLSLPASAGALAVSLAVGLIAGVYPAGRAARLAPIDALRGD